jgi:hypothetical protein
VIPKRPGSWRAATQVGPRRGRPRCRWPGRSRWPGASPGPGRRGTVIELTGAADQPAPVRLAQHGPVPRGPCPGTVTYDRWLRSSRIGDVMTIIPQPAPSVLTPRYLTPPRAPGPARAEPRQPARRRPGAQPEPVAPAPSTPRPDPRSPAPQHGLNRRERTRGPQDSRQRDFSPFERLVVAGLARESLRAALYSISSNRLRSFLTTVGIIVGIAAVIVLAALGDGMKTLQHPVQPAGQPDHDRAIRGVGHWWARTQPHRSGRSGDPGPRPRPGHRLGVTVHDRQGAPDRRTDPGTSQPDRRERQLPRTARPHDRGRQLARLVPRLER